METGKASAEYGADNARRKRDHEDDEDHGQEQRVLHVVDRGLIGTDMSLRTQDRSRRESRRAGARTSP